MSPERDRAERCSEGTPGSRPLHPDWRRSVLGAFWVRRMQSGVTAYLHTHAPDRHVGAAARYTHMSGLPRLTIEAAAQDAARLAEIIDAYERETGRVSDSGDASPPGSVQA